MPSRFRQAAVVATALAQLVVPAFAPRRIDEVTEKLPRTPVRPVPATFAIWGPIFAASGAYAAHQARPSQAARPLQRRVGWLMAAAFAGDALWELVVPRRHVDAGQLLVTGTAASATAAFLVFTRTPGREQGDVSTRADEWLVGVPVGSLAGWTMLATAISTADTLARHGVTRSPRARALGGAGLVGAALAGGATACLHRGGLRRPAVAAYAAAMAWGAGGIALRVARSGRRT